MAIIQNLECDVCGAQIAKGSRRYEFAATLRSINGDTTKATRGIQWYSVGSGMMSHPLGERDLDICSVACAHKALEDMIREVTPSIVAEGHLTRC